VLDFSSGSLTVPVGQIPVPSLSGSQDLAGDYGVLHTATVRLVNDAPRPARLALYANPRGGRAMGTFVIDRTLLQVQPMQPFTYYKLREYAVPARASLTTTVVTMPEIGSVYPLNLVFGPDDGSIPPGAPGSPVY